MVGPCYPPARILYTPAHQLLGQSYALAVFVAVCSKQARFCGRAASDQAGNTQAPDPRQAGNNSCKPNKLSDTPYFSFGDGPLRGISPTALNMTTLRMIRLVRILAALIASQHYCKYGGGARVLNATPLNRINQKVVPPDGLEPSTHRF